VKCRRNEYLRLEIKASKNWRCVISWAEELWILLETESTNSQQPQPRTLGSIESARFPLQSIHHARHAHQCGHLLATHQKCRERLLVVSLQRHLVLLRQSRILASLGQTFNPFNYYVCRYSRPAVHICVSATSRLPRHLPRASGMVQCGVPRTGRSSGIDCSPF
jgi:hypothetical protein